MFQLVFQIVLIYAKQENEDYFHPLHLVPPTLVGLAMAVSNVEQIDRINFISNLI